MFTAEKLHQAEEKERPRPIRKGQSLTLLLPSFAVGSNGCFPESGNESQSQPTGPFDKKADKYGFVPDPASFLPAEEKSSARFRYHLYTARQGATSVFGKHCFFRDVSLTFQICQAVFDRFL